MLMVLEVDLGSRVVGGTLEENDNKVPVTGGRYSIVSPWHSVAL